MRRPLTAAALVFVLAGCGSTIEPGGSQPAASSGEQGLSLPSVAAQARSGGGDITQPSSSGRGPSAAASAAGSSSGSASAASGPTGTPAGGGHSTQPASVPPSATAPVDHTPIKIGLMYAKNVGAAGAIVGLTGLSTGDTLAQATALVRWVNSHGGMGGHPIQLLSYGINATSGGDTNAVYQAACTSLTQDDHVRYVVTILSLPSSNLPCFAQAGVGVLDDEAGVSDSQRAQYSDYLAGPSDFGLSRETTNLVDDLWRRGWLTSTSKVGSLTYDEPAYESAVSGALTKALAAHGLKITSEASIPNSSASITDAGSVVLKFRSTGVDRVIPIGPSPLFVMISAALQGYHPAYAVNSLFGPGALLESAAPKAELVDSAGIGWQPFLDIGKGTQPPPVSSNQTLCFKLMQAAGQASTSATTRGFEAQVCDLVLYLKALGDALPSLPSNLLTAGGHAIGTGFRPAATFRSDMSQHSDGVAAYRDLAYETSCSCYQYVSPIRRTTS